MLAKQPFDLGADLRLGGGSVGPIDCEIGTNALDELVGDFRQRRVGLHVLDAAGQGVVEGGFLSAEAELLVPASRVAEALGDLDQRSTTSALVSCLSS